MLPGFHHSYPGYPYLLHMNGQVVAGFHQLLLQEGHLQQPQKRMHLSLQDGLTYDRTLLRWATNWRKGVYWLQYALFWLRPAKDLLLEKTSLPTGESLLAIFPACRVQKIEIGRMLPDGAYPIVRMRLRYSALLESRRVQDAAVIAARFCSPFPVGPARDAGAGSALPGD